MKVLSSSQIRSADKFTILQEPISSIDLMERASRACISKILVMFPENEKFSVFCGTGNNGGDGLAIARLLSLEGKNVDVYLIGNSNPRSPDNQQNLERLNELKSNTIYDVRTIDDINKSDLSPIIIDALFGTGLNRSLTGLFKDVIELINNYDAVRIAIDVPSGLFPESDNSKNLDAIIKANHTLSFEVPKLSFFLPSLYPYIGEWILLPIGLDKNFINSLDTDYYLTDEEVIIPMLKKRSPFSHKGTFGHALIIAGSYGKVGAAVLSSMACIKSGAGLVTGFIPKCGYSILQISVPEVMIETSLTEKNISGDLPETNYTAIGIGPGIGMSNDALNVLKQSFTSPLLVLDADALNLLGKNKELLAQLPKNTILTPHPKEFERMFGNSVNDFDRLQLQRKASKEYGVYIVRKGKNTAISCPDGKVYFNNTGNPGMATAGSGDVLTGIITGLLAQGYTPFESAVLGVHVHGLSGDLAKSKIGEEAIIASEITEYLGEAFLRIHSYEK